MPDGFRATTITSFMSASVDPPQLLVSIELDGQMDAWLERSGVFGVSTLSWEQQLLADRFAGFAPLISRKFAEVPHFTAVTGAPLLQDSIAWADCRVEGRFVTGDHRCVLGTIVALGRGKADAGRPLLYYRSRYQRLP